MAISFQHCARRFTPATVQKLISRVGQPTIDSIRSFCSHDDTLPSPHQFGHSVILLQDGLNIEELPIAVRIANHRFGFTKVLNPKVAVQPVGYDSTTESSVFQFCHSLDQVINVLGQLNIEQVTAPVAYQALSKMAELGLLNRSMTEESFTKDAVVLQLGTTICKSGTVDHLIFSLRLILLPSFPAKIGQLRQLLAQNCLDRVLIDQGCTIAQVCSIVQLFSAMGQQQWADKCWVGLIMIQPDFNPEDVSCIIRILPLLKESRRAVFNHLERSLTSGDIIDMLDERTIIQILTVVRELKLPHKRICSTVSARWIRLHFHILTEEGMANLMELFRRLDHFHHVGDWHLFRAMERHFKNSIRPNFMAEAADYCRHFRICPPTVFNKMAEHFIRMDREGSLDIRTAESVLKCFGDLNFPPVVDDFAFWSSVEQLLDKQFSQFQPESLLHIFISCILLQRYPMNFVQRIFSQQFIRRLHQTGGEDDVEKCRYLIKVIDVAMSFECGQYGPHHVLPKDYFAKSMVMPRDGRISSIVNGRLVPLLQPICARQRFTVAPFVILRDLPLSPIYTVDVLVSPADEPNQFRYGYVTSGNDQQQKSLNGKCLAIVIHPPEHYVTVLSGGKRKRDLIGVEMMRHRHLSLMGFRKVIHLDWHYLADMKNEETLRIFLDRLVSPFFEI